MDGKKFMINPILNKTIEEILKKDSKADEEKVVDQILRMNNISMKKQVIKIGVKHYFKKNKAVTPMINNVEQNYGLDVVKKKVKKNPLQMEFIDKPHYKFQNLGGISDTLTEIFSYIISPIQKYDQLTNLGVNFIKGFILAGPIGSGKTLLANCILSYLKNQFGFFPYFISVGSLLGSDAQQKMKKIFEAAQQNQPSIILFDDIDLMCQKQTSRRPQGSPISFFISEIDKIKEDRIYLLATSSGPEKLDIILKKLNRFEKTISISTTGDESRFQIINKLLDKVNHDITSEQLKEISKITSGYMAADLQLLIKEAGIQSLNNEAEMLSYQCLRNALKFVQPILKKQGFTDIPTTTLDDVGGLQQLKIQLERQIIVPIRQQSKFKQMNFDIQSGGVLLYGPPGCGKTMLAKAIANAVRANFIIVKGPELLNKYVGESEQAVREVFGRAQRAAPCVIFFDEFDALAPKRSDQGNQVTQRVVNTLLTALDGVEERKMVFVIAATNRKDMIDEATLRSGRIQKHLYVPQPDKQERVQILKAITKHLSHEADIDFTEISEKTDGFSGADLRFLVKEAVVSAVTSDRKQISYCDLKKALEQFLQNRKKEKKVSKYDDQIEEENEKYEFKLMREQKKRQLLPIEQQNSEKKSESKYLKLKNSILASLLRDIIGKEERVKQNTE